MDEEVGLTLGQIHLLNWRLLSCVLHSQGPGDEEERG